LKGALPLAMVGHDFMGMAVNDSKIAACSGTAQGGVGSVD
jgi:hypothetical protein